MITPDRTLYFYSGSWGKVNPMPSGLFSSSAQIGRTGIYSGSGTLNGLTRVDNLGACPFRIENINNVEDFKFVVNPNTEIFIGQNNGTNIIFTPDPFLQIGTNNHYIVFDPVGSNTGVIGLVVSDSADGKGIQYASDYKETLKLNDRSIPDVGTIRDHLTSSYAMNGRNYKVISFSMTQTVSNDPVIENILQNDYTTLDINIFRNSEGHYIITVDQDIFSSTKTFVISNNHISTGDANYYQFSVLDGFNLRLRSYDMANSLNTADLNTDTPLFVEIRTYG
jgi:hypothetical protein